MSESTKLYNAVHAIVSHALKFEGIMGYLPDSRYLVGTFDIPYEFADHIMIIVNLLKGSRIHS